VTRTFVALGLGLISVATLDCKGEPIDVEPASVVEEFVRRMQRVHGDPKAAHAAYELLWRDAQNNLGERAKRASAVGGRKVLPEEMIAPSRFALAFEPKHYAAEVQGDWAIVVMTGEGPEAPRRSVKCVRENGRWRIVMELPLPPTIQKRLDALPER
jgi:hypothetical protein